MESDIIWAACALSCCGVFGFLGSRAVAVLADAHRGGKRTVEQAMKRESAVDDRITAVEDERDRLASRVVDLEQARAKLERDIGHLKNAMANRPANVKRATAREIFG